MNRNAKIALACLVGVIAVFAVNYMRKPHTFDECILKNMPNAQAERAAAAIYGACRSRFPLQKFDIDAELGVTRGAERK